MFGKTRHGRAYYSCYPAGNNADRLDRYPSEHPKAVYVREDTLTEALDHVIATRVFGPDRHAFLRHSLAQQPGRKQHADARRAETLTEQIDDLTARQDRLITELETTDPTDRGFRDRLRHRFDTLETERAEKTNLLPLQVLDLATQRGDAGGGGVVDLGLAVVGVQECGAVGAEDAGGEEPADLGQEFVFADPQALGVGGYQGLLAWWAGTGSQA
jgi:hypothetical protein